MPLVPLLRAAGDDDYGRTIISIESRLIVQGAGCPVQGRTPCLSRQIPEVVLRIFLVTIGILTCVITVTCAQPEPVDQSDPDAQPSNVATSAAIPPADEPASTVERKNNRQVVEDELREAVGGGELIENLIVEMRQAGARGDEIREALLREIRKVDGPERVELVESLRQLLSTAATVFAPTATRTPPSATPTPDRNFRLGGTIICVGSSRLDVLDIQGSTSSMSWYETEDFQVIDEKWWYSPANDEGSETWITFADNYGLVKGWSNPDGILRVAANYKSCE